MKPLAIRAIFTWAFDCAGEAGLPFSIHAGEPGAQSVRDTLDAYNPPRIGHGRGDQ